MLSKLTVVITSEYAEIKPLCYTPSMYTVMDVIYSSIKLENTFLTACCIHLGSCFLTTDGLGLR